MWSRAERREMFFPWSGTPKQQVTSIKKKLIRFLGHLDTHKGHLLPGHITLFNMCFDEVEKRYFANSSAAQDGQLPGSTPLFARFMCAAFAELDALGFGVGWLGVVLIPLYLHNMHKTAVEINSKTPFLNSGLSGEEEQFNVALVRALKVCGYKNAENESVYGISCILERITKGKDKPMVGCDSDVKEKVQSEHRAKM